MESLHDMRVASRRLRAAMSVFESAFPRREFAPLEKEAARVTDALGAVRDADVQIEYLQSARGSAALTHQVGIDALIEHLTAVRERDRMELVKELDRLNNSHFRRDFHKMIVPVPPLESSSRADATSRGAESWRGTSLDSITPSGKESEAVNG